MIRVRTVERYQPQRLPAEGGSVASGHDAEINIVRRILQAQGAEVISLGQIVRSRTARSLPSSRTNANDTVWLYRVACSAGGSCTVTSSFADVDGSAKV